MVLLAEIFFVVFALAGFSGGQRAQVSLRLWLNRGDARLTIHEVKFTQPRVHSFALLTHLLILLI